MLGTLFSNSEQEKTQFPQTEDLHNPVDVHSIDGPAAKGFKRNTIDFLPTYVMTDMPSLSRYRLRWVLMLRVAHKDDNYQGIILGPLLDY